MGYTNSPLVDYVRLSPNHSGLRNHAIDTITIHCVVGQCSVETLGAIFAPTSRQASCNYGVAFDGRIGMYVEEKNRSWCTSSASNDNRAITIEVASDTTHPYAVNQKAYDATIKLVADICKRNNIKRLTWKADKGLIGRADLQNMTAHRWFANKACPGDYLYARFGDIANKVNAIIAAGSGQTPIQEPTPVNKNTSFPAVPFTITVKIDNLNYRADASMSGAIKGQTGKGIFTIVEVKNGFGKLKSGVGWVYLENADYCSIGTTVKQGSSGQTTPANPTSGGGVPTSDPGNPAENSKKIWDYLMTRIGNEYGVAGVLGNIQAESACMPNNLQQTFETKLGMTDESYTKAVDNGTYTNFVNDSAGYGLVQWTFWSLKRDLLAYVQGKGKSIGDLDTQLEFLCKQLSESYKSSVWDVLKSAKSIRQASDAMLLKFERPADQSVAVQERRAAYGQEFYSKYATKVVTPTQPSTVVKTLKFATGDIVKFAGGNHYASASATSGTYVPACTAKVTGVYGSGTHPYHVRAIDANGNFKSGGVYGWVDESLLSKNQSEIVYTVVAGDTLSKIAAKYGTTYQKLAAYNGIANPNIISVGQKIRIPGSAAQSATTPAVSRKSNEEIAREVIKGLWGVGQDRKTRLQAKGYDYNAIQKLVNQMLKK